LIRRVSVAALLAVAIAVIAAGCGSSGDAATTSTSSITKAAFLRRANGICAKARSGLLEKAEVYINHHVGKGKSESEVVADAYKAVLVPSIEEQIAEIRTIGFPSGDEQTIETFLNTLQEKDDEIKTLPSVVSRFPVDRILKPAGDLARAYGLDVCGYGEGPPRHEEGR
jgi:hypothetical protein